MKRYKKIFEKNYIEDKHNKMMKGEKVIVSDDDLDKLEKMSNYKYLASEPNPKRVGTKDTYLAYYKNKI